MHRMFNLCTETRRGKLIFIIIPLHNGYRCMHADECNMLPWTTRYIHDPDQVYVLGPGLRETSDPGTPPPPPQNHQISNQASP